MENDLLQAACWGDCLDAFTQFLGEVEKEVFQHGGDEHEYHILVHKGERKVRPSEVIVLNIKVLPNFIPSTGKRGEAITVALERDRFKYE